MRVTAFSLALFVTCGDAATQGDNKLRLFGEHFVLEFHCEGLPAALSQRLGNEALAAAESVWPALRKTIRPPHNAGATILLYAPVSTYVEVEKRHSKDRIKTGAFTRPEQHECHILMFPRLSDAALERVGLPPTTRNNIMLHAAQAVIAQYAETPAGDRWFAEVAAYHVLDQTNNPRGLYGIDPSYDTRCYLSWNWRKKPPTLGDLAFDGGEPTELIRWEVEQGDRALMGQFLAKTGGAGWAQKFLGKQQDVGSKRPRQVAIEAVVGPNIEKAEKKLAEFGKTLKPKWRLHGGEFLQVDGRWLLVGQGRGAATVRTTQMPPEGDYAIRGTFKMEQISHPVKLVFQVDFAEDTLISVTLAEGAFLVARKEKDNTVTELHRGAAVIEADRTFEVSIEVVGTTMRIVLDGKELLSVPCEGRKMRGQWSVSSGDTLTWVESLGLEPLGKTGRK